MPRTHAERGQATVEVVALLPLLVMVALLLWQAAVAGQAIWLSASAARAAARAAAVGGDPASAARATLPPRLEHGLRVRPDRDGDGERRGGGVAVTLRIPAVLSGGAVASTTARARFAPQGP
jgi:hypothetical protein